MFTLYEGQGLVSPPRMSGGKDSALIWAECEKNRYRLLASRELLEDEFDFQIADGKPLPTDLVERLLPIFDRMYAVSDMMQPPEADASHEADIVLTIENYAKYRT